MIAGVKMKVLEVFLLAVLGCCLAEGLLVSKCDLRDQLTRAISSLPEQARQKGLTVDNLVAKIICHVELVSGFNTSEMNQLTPEEEDHHHMEQRHARHPPPNLPTPRTMSPPSLEVWTLYGLFQLSDHLVCSNGTIPSPNICEMDCNNLIDDNTSDDISCVLKIFTNLVEEGFGAAHWEQLKRMIRLIYQEECRDKQASSYFAECPN